MERNDEKNENGAQDEPDDAPLPGMLLGQVAEGPSFVDLVLSLLERIAVALEKAAPQPEDEPIPLLPTALGNPPPFTIAASEEPVGSDLDRKGKRRE
jgi:hypothetical protein